MLATNSSPNNPSRWSLDLVIVSLLVIVFYMLWLGIYPVFTPDEGRYSEVAREMLIDHNFITPLLNGIPFLDKPILYYWLQALAIHLFGMKEWALRFFPCLIGIIGCISTYISGRLLFNRKTALLAATILATTPMYFCAAHYANLDLEIAVWVDLALLQFLIAQKQTGKSRLFWFCGAYIAAALAFLTKGMIGIVFPMAIIGSWMLCTRQFSLLSRMHLSIGIVIFLLLVTPWYYLVSRDNPEFIGYFFGDQQIYRFLSKHHFNNAEPFWFYIPIVIFGLVPWSCFLTQAFWDAAQRFWHNKQQHTTELFLLLWVAIIFIFFSIPHSKTLGYILPIVPALALLLARYLSFATENKKGIHFGFSLFFISSLLSTVALGYLTLYQNSIVPSASEPYVAAIVVYWIIVGMLAFRLANKSFNTAITLYAASSVIFLLTLVKLAGMGVLKNDDSLKPLAMQLKPIISAQDKVIIYHRYYYDLPIYLERPFLVVYDWNSPDIINQDSWARELWYGSQYKKNQQWLINDDTLKQYLSSSTGRFFLFTNKKSLAKIKAQTHAPLYIIAHTDTIVVLSNKS